MSLMQIDWIHAQFSSWFRSPTALQFVSKCFMSSNGVYIYTMLQCSMPFLRPYYLPFHSMFLLRFYLFINHKRNFQQKLLEIPCPFLFSTNYVMYKTTVHTLGYFSNVAFPFPVSSLNEKRKNKITKRELQ